MSKYRLEDKQIKLCGLLKEEIICYREINSYGSLAPEEDFLSDRQQRPGNHLEGCVGDIVYFEAQENGSFYCLNFALINLLCTLLAPRYINYKDIKNRIQQYKQFIGRGTQGNARLFFKMIREHVAQYSTYGHQWDNDSFIYPEDMDECEDESDDESEYSEKEWDPLPDNLFSQF